jgi:hypothetical protein
VKDESIEDTENEDEDDDEDALEEMDLDKPEPAVREIVKVQNPDKELTKTEWDEIIQDNFPELWLVADMCLTAVAQLLLNDVVNPFGLVLVDRPSSGKTIVLNFFSNLHELIFADDRFTPASFVSHAANRKASELDSIDMLPKIKDKVLVVRDLAPIFSQRVDDLDKNVGLLTRVFDGEGLKVSSGLHGQRGYEGTYMFTFLAASTPLDPRIWKTMSKMGSRLFFVNVGSKEKAEGKLADQLIEPVRDKEEVCREATANLIRTLWIKHQKGIDWNHKASKRKILLRIGRMAKLLARFRGAVVVWHDNTPTMFRDDERDKKLDYKVPLTEQPDRINQILYNCARGHAVMRGRSKLKFEDLEGVMKLVLESVPFERARLFKYLIKNNGQLNSQNVQNFLRCTRPTALKEMRTLTLLGLVEESREWENYKSTNIEITYIKLLEEFDWLFKVKQKWPHLFEV